MPYADDLALAQSLADAADTITQARFTATDLVVERKPDLTPVTDADRAVERALVELLEAERPDDAILGEEFGATAPAQRRWVIDPIDGTKNFVRGVPVWATLIGLLDGDDAVVGVVSAPALNRRWWAARGDGRVDEPRRRRAAPPERVAGRATWPTRACPTPRCPGGRESGGATGSSRCSTRCGARARTATSGPTCSSRRVPSTWRPSRNSRCGTWPRSRPIVTEAGGRFTGLDGRAGVHSGNAAASNGLLHDALLAAVGD